MSHAVVVAEELERRTLLSVSLVKDINAGDLGSNPNQIAAAGAGLIFRGGKCLRYLGERRVGRGNGAGARGDVGGPARHVPG